MKHTGANPTHRLLEPLAIRIRAELPAITAGARPQTPACGATHDFLVLCPRPDLTPELLAPARRACA